MYIQIIIILFIYVFCYRGAARDVSFNFIQRWNHARSDNRNSIHRYPALAPTKEALPDVSGTCQCQILRSVSDWSAGQPVEDSIYKAHINLINTAQHYICIFLLVLNIIICCIVSKF